MPNAYISGTGSYVPPQVFKNDDFKPVFGMDTNDEWIDQRTGIRERRYAERGVNTSDLALPAAQAAIEDAGLTPSDIDMIIFATLSPDKAFPGTGVYLQKKLGALEGDAPKFMPCLDVRNQCSGFLYSLSTASAFIKSGQYKHVLVVGAETHSAALDFTTRGRTVATLFGDGAGAVVVSATEEDRGLRCSFLGADGRGAEALKLDLWNIGERPYVKLTGDLMSDGTVSAEMLWPQMNGKVVFKNAVERMIMVLMQSCWDQKISHEDVDLFFFHQANKRINDYVAETLGIPKEKCPSNIERYGNTTAATIPLLMDECKRDGRLKKGMKVAAVAFGAGFTWGSAVIDW
jgi:3-oxoacyl-[acyl-carrier-protein] synthase-3